MNKLGYLLNLLFVAFIFIYTIYIPVIAETLPELKQKADQLQNQIKTLNAQKEKLQNAIKESETKKQQISDQIQQLSSQISSTSNDIEILSLNISKSEIELSLTNDLIEQYQIEIQRLDKELDETNDRILFRINDLYANSRVHDTDEIYSFSHSNIEEGIVKGAFQEQLKESDEQTFQIATNIKLRKEEEKRLIDEQKAEQERIKAELTNQKAKLETLKITLNNSLITKANQVNVLGETITQSQKNKIELENQKKELESKLNDVQTEIFNKTKTVPGSGMWIKKGTFIGYQGNTGYSLGAHLHFFLSKDGKIDDPCKYLPKGKLSQCGGNGQIAFPMTELNFSRGFTSKHTAIDLWARNQTEIYAAHDGYAVKGKEPCYPFFPVCNGGGANYIIVCESKDCSKGFKTGYWHLK